MPPPDKLGGWRVYGCDWHDEPWRAVGDWQAARHLADCGHEPRLVAVQPRYAHFRSEKSPEPTVGAQARGSLVPPTPNRRTPNGGG